jgi:hypothetical protein
VVREDTGELSFVSYVRLKAIKCITRVYIKEENVIYKVDTKIFLKHKCRSSSVV